jgi:hypothetical protein
MQLPNDAQVEVSRNTKLVDVSGCLPLDYCAGVLSVANVVPRLMSDGVFAEDGLPFQAYLDWGYFALTQGADGSTEILLTPLGQVWFGKRYHKARVTH